MSALVIAIGIWAHLLFVIPAPPAREAPRYAIMGTLLLGVIYFWVSLALWWFA